MKIRLFGTGYGECKTKKKTSKDYRKNGGVLLDDTILIDAPLDIFEVADELGITDLLSKITDVFISHSHPAHFSPEALARLSEKKHINVYATRAVLSEITPSQKFSLFEITPFTKFELSGYEIIALPTNHKTENPSEECLNFLFKGEKTLFYALDGGWINTDAFSVLKSCAVDAVIADCALEAAPATEKNLYHNDIHTLSRIKDILFSSKISHENTRFILSHIPSPRRRAIHEELSPIAKEYGLTLAYDGYFLRI
jgi:hypothetical protein